MKKKIFNSIKDLIKSLIFLLRLHLEIIRDFIFLVLLLIDINNKHYFKVYKIRLLIDFLGQNTKFGWKKNPFARYCIMNDGRFKIFYYSLKYKNSLIFQIFSFFYSFLIEYYLQYSIYTLIPCNYSETFGEYIGTLFQKLNDKVCRAIFDNYYYLYLLEFKDYRNSYQKQNYYKYSIIIFFLESYLNISYYFNGQIFNSKFLRGIENKIELKIEDYF